MKLKDMFDNTKEYVSGFLRSFFSVKRNVVVSVIFVVMLLIYVITGARSKALISELPDQLEADRWSDSMRMAQVSIFTTQDQMITENDIKRFSYTLETKLMDDGVTEPED